MCLSYCRAFHLTHCSPVCRVMAALSQQDLGSVTQLHDPRRHKNDGNNVEDGDDFTSDRCRTGVSMVSILAFLPCNLKSFWCVRYDSPAPTNAQRSMKGEKDEEGSFHHRNKGGWKTMPFIIGELLVSDFLLFIFSKHGEYVIFLDSVNYYYYFKLW